MNLQTVTTTDIQRGFSKILDNLVDPLIIIRDSRPQAVIVEYEDYLDLKKVKEMETTRELEELLAKVHARNSHIPAEEVEKDVEEALKYVRHHRRHKRTG